MLKIFMLVALVGLLVAICYPSVVINSVGAFAVWVVAAMLTVAPLAIVFLVLNRVGV